MSLILSTAFAAKERIPKKTCENAHLNAPAPQSTADTGTCGMGAEMCWRLVRRSSLLYDFTSKLTFDFQLSIRFPDQLPQQDLPERFEATKPYHCDLTIPNRRILQGNRSACPFCAARTKAPIVFRSKWSVAASQFPHSTTTAAAHTNSPVRDAHITIQHGERTTSDAFVFLEANRQ